MIGTIISLWNVDAGTAGLAGAVTLFLAYLPFFLAAYVLPETRGKGLHANA
ncbi:hypothetical protein [Bradyrhizobium altum]|uniref:hypothetical protein n=1 Tax=Bradyrhizobium altum TaxID=1571202 RepID=UPI0035DBF038